MPTVYLDEEALQTVGLWEEVSQYIAGIGWEGVQSMRSPTFREPVLEFLSSVVYVEPDQPEDDHADQAEEPEEPRVHFQLGGVMHDMRLSQFNVFCRFETVESVQTPAYREALLDYPPGYSEVTAWGEIAQPGLAYTPRNTKSTAIRDPVIRVIHRWLVHSIFGRSQSTGNVASHHLFILWCMLHQRRVNPGRYLLHSCTSLGARLGLESTGYICIGSFISRLATSMGRVPRNAMRVVDMRALSTDTLSRMGIIARGADGQFRVVHPDHPAPVDVA